MNRFSNLFAALVAILTTAVICYGVESLSIQQMLQNSPKETAPQASTRIITVRGGTVRQMSYSSVHASIATSDIAGIVKPDGTTTTVGVDGSLHGMPYPNPGIPYSLGNGWGIPFTPSNPIPANYVALPVQPQSVGPLAAGIHFNSYDATTGQFGYSADASVGGSTDYNAVHTTAAGEFAGVASKATPAGADILLIEDSANSNAKKRIRADSLPYLSSSSIGSTVQAYSAALGAVSGTNTGDETLATIKAKLGAAGPGDGYMTAAEYVTLASALQPASTLDATKLSGTAAVNTTGNAATATKLATPRAINGVNFDGSAPITINAVDSTARLAATAQAVDSAKLATVTPSANALTLIGHTFSQMVTDLSTALNAAYHGLTIVGSEITTALGFTPENVANKSTDGTMAANSTTLYPTQSAVRTYVAANGGGGSSAVFKVYTSASWQTKTGYVWYRGTGDPDPTSSMGPYDILNDATATSSYTDVTSLFTGTGPCYLKSDGTCANPAGAGTVTSVGIVPPSFMTVTGSPVASSGNITMTLASGYYIPSTGDQTNWNTKQAALTSGSNIKTVGGVSLMGSGDVGTIGTAYGGTGATNFSFSGTAHKVASASFTTPASNKCVEVDASGNLQIAGSNAACGSGGSGLSTSLTAGNIYIGNAGGTATDTAISGDGTLSSTGALTITKSGGQSFGSNAFTSTAYLSAETDPKVGSVTTGYFCKGTGSQVSCTDANSYLTSASTLDATKLSGTMPHASLPSLLSGDIPANSANTTGSAASLSAASSIPNGTTATTQTAGDNTTKLATTAFVTTAVAAAGGGTGTIAGSTGSTDRAVILSSGVGGSTVQASGVTIATDGTITTPKVSGNADTLLLRDATGTDAVGAGWIGPASTVAANYFLQLPVTEPSGGNQVAVYGASSGHISAMSFTNAPALSAANMTSFPALNQNTTGNAATATALASAPTKCSAGYYPLGIDANGNAQTCTAAGTGTVTAVSVASANGITGSSSGGATPALTITLGAITPSSVAATGLIDGTAPTVLSTATSLTLGSAYKTNYTFNNYATNGTAVSYTLPTAAAGRTECVKNYTSKTGALTVQTSASGQYIDMDGTNSASGGYVVSAGAMGDGACFVGADATHWVMYSGKGTWTLH